MKHILKPLLILVILALLILLILKLTNGLFGRVAKWQENIGNKHEANISELTDQHEIVRFMIKERTGSSFDLVVKFVNANGSDVEMEFNFEGQELHLDFYQIPLEKQKGKFVHIPYKIYSDTMPAQKCTALFNDKRLFHEGVPISYPRGSFYKEDIKAINKLFDELLNETPLSNKMAFGLAIHDLSGIASFKTGIVYSVIARTKGGIEVLEE